jgi:cysteinyl-tRNA synthetase
MPRPEIKFYNSLTKSLEPFETIDPSVVTMYNCGPTVYDYAHIGNFKSFLFADVLRRFLELAGYDVRQVMNLTDVGHMTDDAVADGGGQDKMQAAGERLAEAKKAGKLPEGTDLDPNDPYAIARFYADAFIEDAKQLGIKVASEPDHLPRATDHVTHMQAMIQTLVEKGNAYVADDGAVYFSVQSFPAYGRLSGNTLDELRGGAGGRVSASNQSMKRHPADFLLWKPDDRHLMKWDSPWGTGYPGWHIECSAMARAVLGVDEIDIHTGGEDNIFPHHECEIAQSCCATGHDRFARFWMHGRHLMVEGTKMAKSKGNFFTVRQILDGKFTGRAVDPAVLRFELIKAHYRSQMNFTRKGLEDSASAVQKVRVFAESVGYTPRPITPDDTEKDIVKRFTAELADDLNTAGALGVVFGYLGESSDDAQDSHALLAAFDQVFGVLASADDGAGDDWADAKVAEMVQARADKDWSRSDAIRDELQAAGYEVKQTKEGAVATKKLA